MHRQNIISMIGCILVFGVSGLGAANNIRGQILDSHSDEPIIGVNILILDTDIGAASGPDGYFDIRTEQQYPLTIKVTHIAYKDVEYTIHGDTSLVIRLQSTSVMGKSIVITGERSSIGSDVSATVEVISIESIENLGARDIGDVLRPLSSVSIQATNSGKQYISIRGSNANEVAVFLDGLRLNDTNTGIADLSAIDP